MQNGVRVRDGVKARCRVRVKFRSTISQFIAFHSLHYRPTETSNLHTFNLTRKL